MSTTPSPPLDLNNIQGDILSGLPKKTQFYVFFEILNVNPFKSDLKKLIPFIKTVAQVLKDRDDIADHKRKKLPGLIPLDGVNIAFSHAAFTKLGIDDSSLTAEDPETHVENPFKFSQKINAVTDLGDPAKPDNTTPDWEEDFLQELHGVILISGESHATIEKKKQEIDLIFRVNSATASIKEITTIRGDVRPGDHSGHEHCKYTAILINFGFLDGISNPKVDGFDTVINPGPQVTDQGVILTGRPGDKTPRADWATDGSYLVFRYLFQKVPEFNYFLDKNPIAKDGDGNLLTPESGSELLGARMVGRWKSGAPIDITPFKDDPALGSDPTRNNNFFFEGDPFSQLRCPFAAHVRKTNPRNDLADQNQALNARIMRRGIQFGPEVTEEEKKTSTTQHDRGLLFVAYQTSLAFGFQLQQQFWANSESFPLKNMPPGLDPLIGQGKREMIGLNPLAPGVSTSMPTFIVPRGGEYFFSPSIKGLKDAISA